MRGAAVGPACSDARDEPQGPALALRGLLVCGRCGRQDAAPALFAAYAGGQRLAACQVAKQGARCQLCRRRACVALMTRLPDTALRRAACLFRLLGAITSGLLTCRFLTLIRLAALKGL